MKEGKIIKGIAGFYYVKSNSTIYECSARGVFRKKNISLLIGDDVLIEVAADDTVRGGYPVANIEEVLPRKTQMIRPPVANVDQGIIVFSMNYPKSDLEFLNKLLILLQEQNIKPCICINKIDLDEKDESKAIKETYEKIGYKVILTSAVKLIGIDDLKEVLKDKISFLVGNSGVGKSALLNAVDSDFDLETGKLSAKIQRGKHTTRHVELMPLSIGGYVLDTPGFNITSIEHINHEYLKSYYKEFELYEDQCKFRGCAHINEPSCGVKQALEEGQISEQRYNSYLENYKKLKNIRRW